MKLLLEPEWLKADAKGRPVGVDRENKIILGYVVAQEGPFKTPGRGEFDAKALQTIVKLMRAEPDGLKSRFTHPTLSDDGLGKFLGRAKRPRLDSTRVQREGEAVELRAVRADLHLSDTAFDTPNGNLGKYVLDLAEQDPNALSSSLVVTKEDEVRLNSDGTRKLDDAGNPLPPLWRPIQLHATDILDEGDAVDGLLSAGLSLEGLPDEIVRRATQMLTAAFPDAPREVIRARGLAWLERYLDYRFGPEPAPLTSLLRLRLEAKAKIWA